MLQARAGKCKTVRCCAFDVKALLAQEGAWQVQLELQMQCVGRVAGSVLGLAQQRLARVARGDGSVRVDARQCWCGRATGKRCCVGLFFADEAAVWCVGVVQCGRKGEASRKELMQL